jgi:hypothetical protein
MLTRKRDADGARYGTKPGTANNRHAYLWPEAGSGMTLVVSIRRPSNG